MGCAQKLAGEFAPSPYHWGKYCYNDLECIGSWKKYINHVGITTQLSCYVFNVWYGLLVQQVECRIWGSQDLFTPDCSCERVWTKTSTRCWLIRRGLSAGSYKVSNRTNNEMLQATEMAILRYAHAASKV